MAENKVSAILRMSDDIRRHQSRRSATTTPSRRSALSTGTLRPHRGQSAVAAHPRLHRGGARS